MLMLTVSLSQKGWNQKKFGRIVSAKNSGARLMNNYLRWSTFALKQYTSFVGLLPQCVCLLLSGLRSCRMVLDFVVTDLYVGPLRGGRPC